MVEGWDMVEGWVKRREYGRWEIKGNVDRDWVRVWRPTGSAHDKR